MVSTIPLEDKQTIIKLWLSGKNLKQIHEMTGRARDTICRQLTNTGLYEPGVCKLVGQEASKMFRADARARFAKGDSSLKLYKNLYALPIEEREKYIKKADKKIRDKCRAYYDDLMGTTNQELTPKDKSICKKLSYTDIIVHEDDILSRGYQIKNTMIEEAAVSVDGHCGLAVCLRIFCKGFSIISSRNNTGNIGYLIQVLVSMLGDAGDETRTLNEFLYQKPCRVILDGKNCIGFGHFMKDIFVYTEDFLKIDSI